jgi:tetratricopeptide (TPR) repeat protein
MLLGTLYDTQGKPQKANEYYEKALKINPKFATAANNLAWNYVEHGKNIDAALALAQTAKEQMPDNPQVMDTLGWIYYKKKAYLQAIDQLRGSAEKMTDNPVVRYHLGMAYYKYGNTRLAEKELQQALQLSRDFPGAQEAQEALLAIQLQQR